jgi:hypothetical protein
MARVAKDTVEAVLAGQGAKESLVLVGGERRMNSFRVSCKKKLFSTTISASMHFENDDQFALRLGGTMCRWLLCSQSRRPCILRSMTDAVDGL